MIFAFIELIETYKIIYSIKWHNIGDSEILKIVFASLLFKFLKVLNQNNTYHRNLKANV